MKNHVNHVESAVSIAIKAVMTVNSKESLEEVELRLKNKARSLDTLQYVYVLNEDSKLEGVFSMRDLFSNSNDKLVEDIMSKDLVYVYSDTDQEEVTSIALKKKIKAVPVLDRDGTFKGVVTSRKIFEILSEEHSEDLLYMGGVQKIYSASNIIKSRLNVLILARLPWLLIGLAGGVLAALTVESFEGILNDYIVLAFFLPLVVYMSDAVASQTIAIFIRAMALDNNFSVRRYIVRELSLGFCIALILGFLLYVLSFFWFYNPELSLALGLALFLSILVAVSVALFMTVFINYLKKDPAVGSGPFATIIIDLITIFIYFTVAKMFLPVLLI